MTYLATSVCGEFVVFGCLLVGDGVPHRLVIAFDMVGGIGNGSK